MKSVRHLYYDGGTRPATSGDTFESIDPSNGAAIATIDKASESDIDAAISSARSAFQTWKATTAIARSRILLRAVAILRERNDEVARQETLDTGKPLSETSTVDVVTGADTLEFYANLVASGGLNGESVQLRDDAWFYTRNEPLGVCAGIGAWNYPIQIALWKSAPCLAAGNTMVYKPSEFTPLHGQTLAEIFTEAGLPAGVFNVVHGAGDVGAYLTSHAEIAKVSFTGQVSTGKKVAAAAGQGMKYVTMELGGKSPLIILEDVDLNSAVDGAMMANFFSTGQVCTNGTRVFVPKSLQTQFERKLLEKMQYVRSGDLMDLNTNFGPLVSQVHHEKVIGYVRHGIEVDKATLLYGGLEKISSPPGGERGFWIKPTIFTNCSDEMKIVQEEIFGPVMMILSYENLEEVIARANTTTLGLAAGIFTRDLDLAHKVVGQLEAGITWINTWGESPAEMSVGGWKTSGLGVENGRKGLAAWTQNRSTLVENSGTVPTVFSKL